MLLSSPPYPLSVSGETQQQWEKFKRENVCNKVKPNAIENTLFLYGMYRQVLWFITITCMESSILGVSIQEIEVRQAFVKTQM